MPKISILMFLLELQTQIGILENNFSFISLSNLDILNSVSTLDTHILNNDENTTYVLKNLLLLSSLFSLILGTVVGLAQSRIKRLLAYSTISHIGFILLALAINTEQSIDSFIFYIVQYSLTNLNAFLILIALGYIIHNSLISTNSISSNLYKEGSTFAKTDIGFISELKGQFFSNPLLSLGFTICLFSMAGVPPLMGFFSKQFVLYSAIESGYYFISIVAILVSVVSASYYLKVIRILHTDELTQAYSSATTTDQKITSSPQALRSGAGEIESVSILSNFHSFIISTLTLSILLFVLKPSIILNSTQLLSLSLYNF